MIRSRHIKAVNKHTRGGTIKEQYHQSLVVECTCRYISVNTSIITRTLESSTHAHGFEVTDKHIMWSEKSYKIYTRASLLIVGVRQDRYQSYQVQSFFTQYRDSIISNLQSYHCLYLVVQLAAFTTVTSSDQQQAARFPLRCVHAQKARWSLVAAITATGNTYLRIQVAYFCSRLIHITYTENTQVLLLPDMEHMCTWRGLFSDRAPTAATAGCTESDWPRHICTYTHNTTRTQC